MTSAGRRPLLAFITKSSAAINGSFHMTTSAPIRRPARQAPAADQPRLFDRGTGTHGPAPAAMPVPVTILPAAARGRMQAQIPANIAVKEILAFISSDPSTANWSDQARQDMASTVYIAAVKAGHVGLWERQS